MELVQCGFCNSKVRIDKIHSHISKIHFGEKFENVNDFYLANNLKFILTLESWTKNSIKQKELIFRNAEKQKATRLLSKLKINKKNNINIKELDFESIYIEKIKTSISSDFQNIKRGVDILKSKKYIEESKMI